MILGSFLMAAGYSKRSPQSLKNFEAGVYKMSDSTHEGACKDETIRLFDDGKLLAIGGRLVFSTTNKTITSNHIPGKENCVERGTTRVEKQKHVTIIKKRIQHICNRGASKTTVSLETVFIEDGQVILEMGKPGSETYYQCVWTKN